MKGYRTIIVNILMLIAAISGMYNIEIPPEQVEAVATGAVSIMAFVNLFLRFITNTPVGESGEVQEEKE